MAKNCLKSLLVGMLIFALAPSYAVPIRWASGGTPVGSSAFGEPDGASGLESSTSLGITGFDAAIDYFGLAAFLGIPAATLAHADLIAFESNGGSPAQSGGWESSRWLFSDGATSFTVDFSELVGAFVLPAVIANGSVTGSAYDAYFGLATGSASPVMSFLLFDLPDSLDSTSPVFSVSMVGGAAVGLPGEGTPDPDAIGLIPRSQIPEPSSIWLAAIGAAVGVLTKKRRKRSARQFRWTQPSSSRCARKPA